MTMASLVLVTILSVLITFPANALSNDKPVNITAADCNQENIICAIKEPDTKECINDFSCHPLIVLQYNPTNGVITWTMYLSMTGLVGFTFQFGPITDQRPWDNPNFDDVIFVSMEHLPNQTSVSMAAAVIINGTTETIGFGKNQPDLVTMTMAFP